MGAFAINQSRYDIAKCREWKIDLGCLLENARGRLEVILGILTLSHLVDLKLIVEKNLIIIIILLICCINDGTLRI